jgi:hypothetical protein
MRVKLVLAAGLAVIAALVLVLLLDDDQRRAGSNYVPEFGPVVELRGADEHCEPEQLVPGDSGALNLLVGTYGRPTPELRVTLSAPGRGVISEGRLAPGRREGRVIVPIERVEETVGGRVCIRTGPGGRTVLYGRGEQVRLDWLRPGSESKLALLPIVAHRFGLAKPNPFGDWLLLVVGLLLAAAWVVALRTVLREVGP